MNRLLRTSRFLPGLLAALAWTAVATAMLVATLRGGDAVAARSTAELSDIDVELLLTKLREGPVGRLPKHALQVDRDVVPGSRGGSSVRAIMT